MSTAKPEDEEYLIKNLVKGALTLCSCGGEHEIGRDEELCAGMDLIEECENTDDGVVLVLESGARFRVTVTRLP